MSSENSEPPKNIDSDITLGSTFDESSRSDNAPKRRRGPTRAELSVAPVVANALQVAPHGDFVDWLAGSGGALAVSTYNSGKLAVLSADAGGLRVKCWKFARPMGLAYDGDRLAVVARGGILAFNQRLTAGFAQFEMEPPFVTGLVDAHDAAWGRRGLYFVNTRFNCVARTSQRVRFLRRWQPHFVPGVVASDACHLNGLAMQNGIPKIATAFCESAQPKGWKQEDRFTAGVAIDIQANAIVARGLCMPHSPRRFAGKWWLCNSGEGTLCRFDPARGDWTVVAALPGFARGLCRAGEAAVVGLSRIRPKHVLDAPPVRERCGTTIAGVAAVEIHSGRIIGWLNLQRGGSEVYDVAFLPGVSAVDFPTGKTAATPKSARPA